METNLLGGYRVQGFRGGSETRNKKMETTIFLGAIWGFPKIRGAILGVPIIRIILFWGSILGSPYFGKLPYRSYRCYFAASTLSYDMTGAL